MKTAIIVFFTFIVSMNGNAQNTWDEMVDKFLNSSGSSSNSNSRKLIKAVNEIDQNKYYYISDNQGNALENPGHGDAKKSEAKLIVSPIRKNDPSQLWKFVKGSDHFVMIVNKKYENYIDVPYGRKNQGETLIGHRNKGGENQKFQLIDAANNGAFYISVKINRLVLTIIKSREQHCLYRPEENKMPGGKIPGVGTCFQTVTASFVKQMPVTGDSNQKWYIFTL